MFDRGLNEVEAVEIDEIEDLTNKQPSWLCPLPFLASENSTGPAPQRIAIPPSSIALVELRSSDVYEVQQRISQRTLFDGLTQLKEFF